MGYRLNIGLVLTKHGVEKIKEAIENVCINELMENSLHATRANIIREAKSTLTSADITYKDEETGSEVFYWEHVKWHPGSVRTTIIENVIDNLDSKNYLYIVIGEELKDINIEGSYYNNPFNMHLVRSINIEKPINNNKDEYEEKVIMNVDGISARVQDEYDVDYASVNYSIS